MRTRRKSEDMYKVCEFCKKNFRARRPTTRFCCRQCLCVWLGKNTQKSGEDSTNWAGDSAGYNAVHKHLLRNWVKSMICEFCGACGKTDWANKTGKYIRQDRSDWLELCRKCHKKFDNEFKKINRISA